MKRSLFVVLLFVCTASVGLFAYSATTKAQELTPSERAALQAQYDDLQREIAAQQKILDDTRAQKKNLTGDVTALTAQINKAQAEINAKNVQLKQLASQIISKTRAITALQGRINEGHKSLASMLSQQNQLDEYSSLEVLFSSEDVSTFFADLDSFAAIQVGMQNLFEEIRDTKQQTEMEKQALTATQNKVTDAKYEVQTKQQKIAGDKTQKQQLLTITANKETEYQKVLAANQAKAATIRAALFPLRDAAAIQFGDALKYAQAAQKSTGVDPALVLAILTQESNLGTNVGQCYMTDDATGDGVGKNTGKVFKGVMSPKRDVPPFLALAAKLGFDPHHQAVSCPIASAGGWGGAMGPAQFIPSTWALYADKIAQAAGKSIANPWEPRDAIIAMSFLLSDNGASAGGYTANYNAAARYYAGWNGPSTKAGKSYASQVMAKIASIQSNIDFLANN